MRGAVQAGLSGAFVNLLENLLRDGDPRVVALRRGGDVRDRAPRLVRLRKEREPRRRVRGARGVQSLQRNAEAFESAGRPTARGRSVSPDADGRGERRDAAGHVHAVGGTAGGRRRGRSAGGSGGRRGLSRVRARGRRRGRRAVLGDASPLRRERGRRARGRRGRARQGREVLVDALGRRCEVSGPGAERLGQGAGESALQVRRVEKRLTRGAVLLAMLLPGQDGGGEGLVDVADGALGGRLLDEGAAELEVVHHRLLKRLVERRGICRGQRASLLQQRSKLRGDGRLEGLAAGDESQRAREGGHHEMRSLAESRRVGLDGEILQHEFARRHARNRHRALDNRGDNLANRAGERDREKPRERQTDILRKVRRGSDLDVLLHGGGDAAGHVRAHLPAVALAQPAHAPAEGAAATG